MSSCTTHFECVSCPPSFCILSCRPSCGPAIFSWGSRSSISMHKHIYRSSLRYSPVRTEHMTIPSQLLLSEQGYHWSDISFPRDVSIGHVFLLGLVSCPSPHYCLSGVEFLWIFFLTAHHSDPCVIVGLTVTLIMICILSHMPPDISVHLAKADSSQDEHNLF